MKELFRTPKPLVDNQPDHVHDALLELAADLPQELADFVNLLEKRQVRPAKEVEGYYFNDDTDAVFYTYPSVVKDYMDLYGSLPVGVKISRGRNNVSKASLHQLNVEIVCDDGSLITLSCPAYQPLEHPYAVSFAHELRDSTKKYSCPPSEVGALLSSIVLSPDQLSDIDEMRRGNERIDEINPRSPLFQSSLASLLADKADDFSSSQTYRLDIDQQREYDGDSKPSFELTVDQYANGATAYDISARLRYSDKAITQQASLHAALEVHADGSLNAITGNGITTKKSLDGTKKQELDSGTVTSSIIALLSVKSKEI